jgi:hypothetical protein
LAVKLNLVPRFAYHGRLSPELGGNTNPLNDADLAEFVELQKTFADSPKSWSVDAADVDRTTFDELKKTQLHQAFSDRL